ncbi:MAG: DUF924 family protein [Hyphomonas sp.]|nr:DUF924 family protein [Hyphomonas sp.]
MTALPSPEDVLSFWIGEAANSPAELKLKNRMWFNGGEALDAELRDRFLPLLETLSAGPLAEDWAARGAKGRLAAILVLDQFSRNIFRKSPRAFAQDRLALHLCKEGLLAREDLGLSEAERVFFYLPLEHAEDEGLQARSVDLFTSLHADARPGFDAFTKSTLDYAHQHQDAIHQFGRFPHRNAAVGRVSTPAELDWLTEGGGF